MWSTEGARLGSGRSREAGAEMISQSHLTAMLETLAHWNGVLPSNQHYIEVTIPIGTTCTACCSNVRTEAPNACCMMKSHSTRP